jgi:hypothetical protein
MILPALSAAWAIIRSWSWLAQGAMVVVPLLGLATWHYAKVHFAYEDGRASMAREIEAVVTAKNRELSDLQRRLDEAADAQKRARETIIGSLREELEALPVPQPVAGQCEPARPLPESIRAKLNKIR